MDRELFTGGNGSAYENFHKIREIRIQINKTMGPWEAQTVSGNGLSREQLPPWLQSVKITDRKIKLIISPNDNMCGQRVIAYYASDFNVRKHFNNNTSTWKNAAKAVADKYG